MPFSLPTKPVKPRSLVLMTWRLLILQLQRFGIRAYSTRDKIRQEDEGHYKLKDAHVELCDEGTLRKVIEVARRFGEEFGKKLGLQ